MPSKSLDVVYGNLQSYKLFVRPSAHRLFGSLSFKKKSLTKHQENVQRLLEILALHGALTTWGIAKIRLANDRSMIRIREKEFRRLLIGRIDRGKKSQGLIDVGLVVKDETVKKEERPTKYRLSLHGILYCLDVLDFNNNQIDIIATKYSKILPKVFGKWDYLKSLVGEYVYGLRILSRGLLLDNPQIARQSVPLYELMSFTIIKYRKNFETISEEELANQISYWFYSNLLYSSVFNNKRQSKGIQRLKSVLNGDKELNNWYFDFYQEVKRFYQARIQILDESTIF